MSLGFETDRLKTGTPARVDSRSIDYRGLEVQEGGTRCYPRHYAHSVPIHNHLLRRNLLHIRPGRNHANMV